MAFANGIADRVLERLKTESLIELVVKTFEISAIIWLAMAVGLYFLLRARPAPAGNADLAVAVCACVAFVIPVAPLSVVAMTAVALYGIMRSGNDSMALRGNRILLAATVPLLWVRALFSLLSGPILQFDAKLVSGMVGTNAVGNTIAYPDGSGYLWIAPGCSSVTNLSLAILCWVIFTQVFYRPRHLHEHLWCVLAGVAVVAINVTRLTLIVLYPEHQNIAHGEIGAAIANWTSMAAIIGICALGVRHEISARH